MARRALIIGVTGQDGAYLARLLLDRGYEVHGTSRDAALARLGGLAALGIRDRVRLSSVSSIDFRSIARTIERVEPRRDLQPFRPVFRLAVVRTAGRDHRKHRGGHAQSAGGAALRRRQGAVLPRRILGVFRRYRHPCGRRGYGIPSEEPVRRGQGGGRFARRQLPRGVRIVRVLGSAVQPRIAAAAAAVRDPKDHGGRHANWGRQRRATGARRSFDPARLGLGPGLRETMWKMLQLESPEEFVIASGISHSLEDFVSAAFAELGLDWREHVDHDASLRRPSDIACSLGDPSKAARLLGWKAGLGLEEIIARMLRAEREGQGWSSDGN
jgi:GDPmannose 4,6-dehydratase